MTFPTTYYTAPTVGANLSSNPHSTLHSTVNAEVQAIEATLGLNPQGAFATVTARIASLELWTPSTIRLTSTTDAALASTGHAFQIGPTAGANLIMDGNEIMARNNGATNTLSLQNEGGAVDIQGNTTVNNPNPASDTPGVQLDTRGSILITADSTISAVPNIRLDRPSAPAANTGETYIQFRRTTGATAIGSVTIASSTSVAYNTTSDYRLKESEGTIGDAASRVQTLARLGFRGRWIADEANGEVWDMLNAHDIAEVAPYAVIGERDATSGDGDIVPQQVNFGALIPLLVSALGNALDRIEQLEAAA